MTKKILTVFLITVLASVIAGIYGIINDQISYTISPEYYTKFKFIQFNLANENSSDHIKFPKLFVAIVGFLATWWFGLILGFVLGLFGLLHKDWKTMLKVSLKSIFLAILVTLVFGILGILYGNFHLSNLPKSEFSNWYFPQNLVDFKKFIIVGSMHNFSYIGGIIGLVFGIFHSVKSSRIKQ